MKKTLALIATLLVLPSALRARPNSGSRSAARPAAAGRFVAWRAPVRSPASFAPSRPAAMPRPSGAWMGARVSSSRTPAFHGPLARRDAPPAPAPQSLPPYDTTPGALIRSEGLGYSAAPTNDAHWQTSAWGYAIVQDPNQAVLVSGLSGPAPRSAPAGRASGRNAITPNPAADGN